MKKILIALFFVATFYLSLALLYGPMDLSVVPVQIGTLKTQKYYQYKGVLNVQSTKSSGSGSIEEIGWAAQEADLDFVVITDTNNFEIEKVREIYHGSALVVIDGEYSYLDSRLLNLNFKSTEHLIGPGRSQMAFANLLSQDPPPEESGFFVLTHPLKEGYMWDGELPSGLNGIEIYNLRYIWRRAWQEKRNSFIWAFILYPINIQWSFARLFASYSHPEIPYWDNNNTKQKLFAYAGADAESRARMPGGEYWQIPSYKTLFSVLRNHVFIESELTGDPKADRDKLMNGLKSGNFFIGLDLIGDTSGFRMGLVDDEDKHHPMGSEVSVNEARQLYVQLLQTPNVPFKIHLYRNGDGILVSNSSKVELDIHGAGVYRAVVEVKLDFPFPDKNRWIPWITSNPIYVK